VAEITNDLGGADRLSEAQRQLVRRCATLSIECEKLDASALLGEPIDLAAYGMLVDRLGRAFQRLGLKRVAREIEPDLNAYIEQHGDAA
jgi:hypothetical protein